MAVEDLVIIMVDLQQRVRSIGAIIAASSQAGTTAAIHPGASATAGGR